MARGLRTLSAVAILTSLFAAPGSAYDPDSLIPGIVGTKFGYRDRQGNVVIEGIYDRTCFFSGGMAAVRKERKWGFIDNTGKYLLPPAYDAVAPRVGFSQRLSEENHCGEFTGDVAVVKVKRKFGVIDRKGNFVVDPAYYGVLYASYTIGADNSLVHTRSDGSWFFSRVEKYLMRAGGTGDWDLVKQSDLILEMKDGKVSRILRNPNPSRPDLPDPFAPGLYRVERDYKWGYEDEEGSLVIPAIYREAGIFSEGLAPVKKDDKWGYIDGKGAFRIEPRFDYAQPFHEGLAAVQIDRKWGYIDTGGKIAIPPVYIHAYHFSGGKARVLMPDGKTFGFIDKTGEVVR